MKFSLSLKIHSKHFLHLKSSHERASYFATTPFNQNQRLLPLNLSWTGISSRYVNIVLAQELCTQTPWVSIFLPQALALGPWASYLTSLALFTLLLYQPGFNQKSRASMRYILRDLLQGIGLCDCEGWLPKSKIYQTRPSGGAGWNSGVSDKAVVRS